MTIAYEFSTQISENGKLLFTLLSKDKDFLAVPNLTLENWLSI